MSRKKHDKHNKGCALFRLMFFPLLFVWLEVFLHLFMDMQMMFSPIFILYGLAYGFAVGIITNLWKDTFSLILTKVLALLISVLYAAEFVAKTILQTFYPFSILGTAAENHLENFALVILQCVWQNLLRLVIFLLPALLFTILCKRYRPLRMKKINFAVLSLFLGALLYALGLLFVNGSWSMDITPSQLYNSDTDYDDQVEQLGLANMLRLDVKHMIWPAESRDDPDPVGPLPVPPADEDDPSGEKYGYNKMNVDLQAVADSTKNSDIKWLASYFSSAAPTRKNAYTGIFEGYNVVFITVEGLSGYGISEKYTPTLYKMANSCFSFTNFYTALHYTSTSGGECQNLLGLYPKSGNPATMSRTGTLKTNTYFALARQLGRKGYTNIAYHDYNYNLYNRANSHTNLGYKYYYGTGEGKVMLNNSRTWIYSDNYMMEVITDPSRSISFLNKKYSDKPFNIYCITISGHTPYVKNSITTPYQEELSGEKWSATAKYYEATVMEADRAVETLVKGLDAAGVLDKTVIVVVPDHIPYGNVDVLEEISGKYFGSSEDGTINEKNADFDVYRSCLIMWNSAMEETVIIDKPTCQVDILPTLSNLLGLEYDSRMLAGSDSLSGSEGLVVFSSKCWLSSLGFYNRYTSKFTLNEGVSMSQSALDQYVAGMKNTVDNKLAMTAKIVENDFYDYVFGSGRFIYTEGEKIIRYTASELEEMYSNHRIIYPETLHKDEK